MDEKERSELDLEEIMKEFGSTPKQEEPPEEIPEEQPAETPEELLEDLPWPESVQEQPDDMAETKRMDPVAFTQPEEGVSGDTVRLEGLRGKLTSQPHKPATQETEKIWQPGDTVHADIFSGDWKDGDTIRVDTAPQQWRSGDTIPAGQWKPEDTIHTEPFSAQWEPEYEQPMGEYTPPQPIQFQPRSRLHELKRKLVAGPEKRYYELSEQGVGRLQTEIFLSVLVVLICAISTVMYAFGYVQDNRLRLMVFGQFMTLLVSALLGSYQLIEGAADIKNKRFTLNSMLLITFLVCVADGILCLRQLRVPCCAAFSLQVTMSLWSTCHGRNREMAQMDTLRRAVRLDGVAACPDYLDVQTGLLRTQGQVEDFMEHYAKRGGSEKKLHTYALVASCIAVAIGIAAGVRKGISGSAAEGISAGLQVAAVSLLAAMPATAFISQSRPAWLLDRRLHKLGTVLCGWRGVEGLCGNVSFPITFSDLYPPENLRLNGVKYFGSREPEQVVAYATAVMAADGCGLAGLFEQLLDSHNGRHYDAYNLQHFENGGLAGVVEGETVLLGSASFMKEMNITVPENAKVGYAVYMAVEGELSGLFAVSYENNNSAVAGLTTLTAYNGLQCVLTAGDFMLTYGFMRNKFGIKSKRFWIPEHEVRAQLREKKPAEDAQALLLTTALGLAPVAYGVTGARVLKSSCRMGMLLHIIGGAVGLAIMVLLVALGALSLLTPANMFLYQLVWAIPALLITEWTRSV